MATVLSLLILVVGLRSLFALDVRQYPSTRNTVVTVSTFYPGADSDLVKGFITTPLMQAIAEAEGIDYLFATSTQGRSTIEAHMQLNYDPNAALSAIQAKVAGAGEVLPAEAQDPVIDTVTGDPTALMYIAFFGDQLTPPEATDYLQRVVQPLLQSLPGVAQAQLIGGQTFAMRVWLDPERMAALGVTAVEVDRVLRNNNFLAGVGQAKGEYVAIDLSVTTDVSTVEAFRNLVVRSGGGTLVRLEDIAEVELGSEDYDSAAWYKRSPAVYIGIQPAPGANPLTVAGHVHAVMPEVRAQLPEGLRVHIPYDASVFIGDSIDEVFKTLAEAVGIVLLVVFLSLGSMRAALVPAIVVPLSLIGAAFLMLLAGFSINLLTLLALVLAIGLVVDDAIVMVENVHRHIELGRSPTEAALFAARELALPVIAMTTTLIAVYAPVGFMGGLVGTLFTEFAFALAGAVLISGVVALTLSPVLAATVLHTATGEGRFERAVERFFKGLERASSRLLAGALRALPATLLFGFGILLSIGFLFAESKQELAPTEDQSILFFAATAPQTATLAYDEIYSGQIVTAMEEFPEYLEAFLLLGLGGNPSSVFGGFKMPPPDERERSQMDIQPQLLGQLLGVPGFSIAVFPRPSLPGAGQGLPLQFVITSDRDYSELNEVAGALRGAAMGSGKFLFLTQSVDLDRPKVTVVIDRDRAGDLGLSMRDIGQNLAVLLGGNYVNRFSLDGRSYKVIPQARRDYRLDPTALDDYYVRSRNGDLVPLSTVVRFEPSVEPSKRTQFQQLNSITVEGLPAPGVTLGEGLDVLKALADQQFPRGFGYDYKGESRQYIKQGSGLLLTFFLSLMVIYLVLAAQFESWRDPLIILVSVPMSIAGAVVFLYLGFATVNIYTQVGLITLIGLIAKNGILIVEFANQLQRRDGLAKRDAIQRAAAIRLRPILMTTVSMLVAMVPLLTATGPGAVSRFHIGLVIAAGLGIGTLFTLFVVPAMYLLLGRDHGRAAG